MKNLNTLILAIASAAFMLVGCNSSQELTPSDLGEVVIVEHCAGEEWNSTKDNFRASATGTSISSETAKKMARSNAEEALARSISSTMKVVGENYVNSTKFNNMEEVTETFNNLAQTVVDQELRGVVTICNKLTQKSDGTFKYYIALELSGEQIAQAYNERLSKDERIMAEFNYQNFRETFEEEMSKQK